MSNDRPNRKSIRLPHYDYSQPGYYFITICTQNMRHYFGEIVGATLCGRPNAPDAMIETWFHEAENKFPGVRIEPYVVMPNHVHFIVQISQPTTAGDHIGSPLRKIVSWFKTMTTNEYIRGVKVGLYEPFVGRLWQRNYYEHVIRNERDYLEIGEYILDNPTKWDLDSMNDAKNI